MNLVKYFFIFARQKSRDFLNYLTLEDGMRYFIRQKLLRRTPDPSTDVKNVESVKNVVNDPNVDNADRQTPSKQGNRRIGTR